MTLRARIFCLVIALVSGVIKHRYDRMGTLLDVCVERYLVFLGIKRSQSHVRIVYSLLIQDLLS